MPASKSAPYVHAFKVYSIQKTRLLLEQLGTGEAAYFALREADGGRMQVLYQLQLGTGLLLNPQANLHAELAKLGVVLPGSAQIRLAQYMEETKKKLGPDYAKPQLFYLLQEFAKLPHKPQPPRNGQSPLYFDVCDLLP